MSKFTELAAQMQTVKKTVDSLREGLPGVNTSFGRFKFNVNALGTVTLELSNLVTLSADEVVALKDMLNEFFGA